MIIKKSKVEMIKVLDDSNVYVDDDSTKKALADAKKESNKNIEKQSEQTDVN